jgi:hypothetical protein
MPDWTKRMKLEELQRIVELQQRQLGEIPSFVKDMRLLHCKKCEVNTLHIKDIIRVNLSGSSVHHAYSLIEVQVCTVCGTKWREVTTTTTEEYKEQ